MTNTDPTVQDLAHDLSSGLRDLRERLANAVDALGGAALTLQTLDRANADVLPEGWPDIGGMTPDQEALVQHVLSAIATVTNVRKLLEGHERTAFAIWNHENLEMERVSTKPTAKKARTR